MGLSWSFHSDSNIANLPLAGIRITPQFIEWLNEELTGTEFELQSDSLPVPVCTGLRVQSMDSRFTLEEVQVSLPEQELVATVAMDSTLAGTITGELNTEEVGRAKKFFCDRFGVAAGDNHNVVHVTGTQFTFSTTFQQDSWTLEEPHVELKQPGEVNSNNKKLASVMPLLLNIALPNLVKSALGPATDAENLIPEEGGRVIPLPTGDELRIVRSHRLRDTGGIRVDVSEEGIDIYGQPQIHSRGKARYYIPPTSRIDTSNKFSTELPKFPQDQDGPIWLSLPEKLINDTIDKMWHRLYIEAPSISAERTYFRILPNVAPGAEIHMATLPLKLPWLRLEENAAGEVQTSLGGSTWQARIRLHIEHRDTPYFPAVDLEYDPDLVAAVEVGEENIFAKLYPRDTDGHNIDVRLPENHPFDREQIGPVMELLNDLLNGKDGMLQAFLDFRYPLLPTNFALGGVNVAISGLTLVEQNDPATKEARRDLVVGLGVEGLSEELVRMAKEVLEKS